MNLNTTAMMLFMYFLYFMISRPKNMPIVVFRICNYGIELIELKQLAVNYVRLSCKKRYSEFFVFFVCKTQAICFPKYLFIPGDKGSLSKS